MYCYKNLQLRVYFKPAKLTFSGFYVKLCNNFSKNPKVLKKNADNYTTRYRVKDMPNSFNLNTFLQEYQTYGNREYTAVENGKAAMEQREIEMAQAAVGGNSFLSLTLSEKLAELGIGKLAMQQFKDTAINAINDVALNPFLKYLKDNEKVFNGDIEPELQYYAKQMFFSKQEMAKESKTSKVGQRFVLDM